MPPTIVIASNDETVKKLREAAAQRVVDAYGDKLPEAKLLCFFDDQDWWKFKRGKATRGLYSPVHHDIFGRSPEYVRKQLSARQPSSLLVNAFDHIIYIHDSTCDDHRGLTLTFAHELQHFRQYMNTPLLWAASSLIPELKKETLKDLGWTDWADVPHEREARIVGRQTASAIIHASAVQEYIAARIPQAVDEVDQRDWQFIYGIKPTDSYNLAAGSVRNPQRQRSSSPVQSRDSSYCAQVSVIQLRSSGLVSVDALSWPVPGRSSRMPNGRAR